MRKLRIVLSGGENPELFVYEKVAFSPLLWYNKGKEIENMTRREMQWVFT